MKRLVNGVEVTEEGQYFEFGNGRFHVAKANTGYFRLYSVTHVWHDGKGWIRYDHMGDFHTLPDCVQASGAV